MKLSKNKEVINKVAAHYLQTAEDIGKEERELFLNTAPIKIRRGPTWELREQNTALIAHIPLRYKDRIGSMLRNFIEKRLGNPADWKIERTKLDTEIGDYIVYAYDSAYRERERRKRERIRKAGTRGQPKAKRVKKKLTPKQAAAKLTDEELLNLLRARQL